MQENLGGVHIAEAATVKRNRSNMDIQSLHVLHIAELPSRPHIHMQPYTHLYTLPTMPTDHKHQAPSPKFVSSNLEDAQQSKQLVSSSTCCCSLSPSAPCSLSFSFCSFSTASRCRVAWLFSLASSWADRASNAATCKGGSKRSSASCCKEMKSF